MSFLHAYHFLLSLVQGINGFEAILDVVYLCDQCSLSENLTVLGETLLFDKTVNICNHLLSSHARQWVAKKSSCGSPAGRLFAVEGPIAA